MPSTNKLLQSSDCGIFIHTNCFFFYGDDRFDRIESLHRRTIIRKIKLQSTGFLDHLTKTNSWIEFKIQWLNQVGS